ncbi:sensor histidine kinase [Azospirillum picis]|uniref:histidine kinase n=1 Tax=Azospirillum picis TaxID=488438 RepID=A0ABU0MRM2_9PROT|nr:sensor histidine kinase [Azospirillum picis]MBP2300870.1 signal transduction histidine kinase [Azospirillum picis]MDQ0536127.1 signal transduction histidine kinase [Azospirillum picis]
MRFAVLVGLMATAVLAVAHPVAASAPSGMLPAVTLGDAAVVPLTPVIEVLFDPGAALTLDDVASGRGRAFHPLAAGPASFGQSTGALWGRVRLDLTDAKAADRWLLAIDTLLIARADIHLVAADGRVLLHAVRGLMMEAVPAGEIQYAVGLTPYLGQAVTLYLRIQSRFALVMAPVLRTTAAQLRHEAEMTRLQTPLMGAIATMALLFGAQWLLLRSRLYAYAFGAALGILITGFLGSGVNRIYGLAWGNNVDWWILEGGGILALYCLPLFIATYLDLSSHRPALHRALCRGALVMTAINLGLMLLLPHRLLTGLTASFFAISAVSLWLMFIQPGLGRRDRRSLLLAMSPFLVLNCVHLVAFNRWAPELLPWRGWFKELFTIGLATLLMGFSLAVADQFRFRLGKLVAQRTRQLMEANAETEEALIAEQAARQHLRQFIRMAAHEFKNPLAVIDSAAQVLPLLVGTMTDDVRRRLDNIQANVRRLLALIESCFAEDRLDEQGLVLNRKPINPLAMIEEVAHHQKLLHSCEIRIRADARLPAIDGDLDLLRMAFSALIDNAAKYAPAKSVIEVEIAGADGGLRVHVLDRGRGIPKSDRAELFSRYYRASNVASVPGTGLGLYLARSIIARHAGSLSFTDREGGGTVFTVTLPGSTPSGGRG